ncbi:MAG: hypothetical protein AAFV25_26110, partial [Bacteroidota bacterium]
VGFRDVFTIVSFYGNRASIAENLCVNKDEPVKKCRGKCYLSKQLEDNSTEQGEAPPANRLFDHFELKVLPTEKSTQAMLMARLAGKANWVFETSLYQSGYHSAPFQPPKGMV